MAAFGTFLSELCSSSFSCGLQFPNHPRCPKSQCSRLCSLQAPVTAPTCPSPGCAICAHPALQTLLFDSKISSLFLLPVTQHWDFFLSQIPGVLLMLGTDLPWTCHLAEV